MSRPAQDRFWKKVDCDGGDDCCWPWDAAIGSTGYGRFWFDGRLVQAHRFAYELLVGPIPEGLQLDHLCRVRACVNPAHLEPVTQRENLLRGVSPPAEAAAKTHCPKGHPYSGDNLYVYPSGARRCRACDKTWQRRYSKTRYTKRRQAVK